MYVEAGTSSELEEMAHWRSNRPLICTRLGRNAKSSARRRVCALSC